MLNSGSVMGCFGITKDPSSNYLFVTKYYEDGDYLYSRINEAHEILDWRNIFGMLWGISRLIEFIHDESGSFYGNLHGGNLLVRDGGICIIDTKSQCSIGSNKIYGVLPYIAPEILRGNLPTKSSDIYSFGIIMWMFITGVHPWYNRSHDLELASEICSGLRPEIIDGTPNVYIQLMTQCWHSDPSKRPTASQLYEILGNWIDAIDDHNPSELSNQFDIAEEEKLSNLERNKFYQRKIHPQAFYTSRLLYFPELINFTKSDDK